MARPTPHPVKAVLALRRLSVLGLARSLGLSHSHASRVLNGRVPASPRFRQAVAELLGLPEQDLFRPAGEDPAVMRPLDDAALRKFVLSSSKSTAAQSSAAEAIQRRVERRRDKE